VRVKIALLVLALLGGLWGTRSLGGNQAAWGEGQRHATFYDDGSPRSLATLEQGDLHGPARTWHRSGALASEGDYEHGRRQGPWRFWSEDGSLDSARSGEYAADVRSGPLAD
jgi:antitoxin component YwqK of YwqJK toxin-antitoxin module